MSIFHTDAEKRVYDIASRLAKGVELTNDERDFVLSEARSLPNHRDYSGLFYALSVIQPCDCESLLLNYLYSPDPTIAGDALRALCAIGLTMKYRDFIENAMLHADPDGRSLPGMALTCASFHLQDHSDPVFARLILQHLGEYGTHILTPRLTISARFAAVSALRGDVARAVDDKAYEREFVDRFKRERSDG